MSTVESRQRALRERARTMHAAVNRFMTATKKEPTGAWRARREMASFLNETATLLGVVDRDKRNWQTTSQSILRNYTNLVSGIKEEPHEESCAVAMENDSVPCSCWKSRVFEYRVGVKS